MADTTLNILIPVVKAVDNLDGTYSISVRDAEVIAALIDLPSAGVTPYVYNVAMPNPDTEYSQALPASAVAFQIRLQDSTAFRLAFVAGKVAGPVAPYLSIPAGHSYEERRLDLTGITLYFASSANTKVAEISVWTS